MKKAIQDSGGNGAIAVEDRGPLFEGFIGGNNDGTAFVSLADDLEKQVGSALIDGQIPYLVQNKQSRREIAFELSCECPVSLGGTESIKCLNGVVKQYTVAVL